MIKYQRISGVSIQGATALPLVNITPEGKAIGGLPEWATFIDPDYSEVSSVRNRALPKSVLQNTSTFGTDIVKNTVGGNTFINTVENPATLTGKFGDVNADEWTFWFVFFGIQEGSLSVRQDIFTPTNEESGVIAPRIVLNTETGSVMIYENSVRAAGQPVRLRHYMDLSISSPTLIECTFSIRKGLSIIKNGTVVETEPDDRRPLSRTFLGSNMRSLSRAVGNFGMMGHLNCDLSLPENTGHRLRLERFILEKYGIIS